MASCLYLRRSCAIVERFEARRYVFHQGGSYPERATAMLFVAYNLDPAKSLWLRSLTLLPSVHEGYDLANRYNLLKNVSNTVTDIPPATAKWVGHHLCQMSCDPSQS